MKPISCHAFSHIRKLYTATGFRIRNYSYTPKSLFLSLSLFFSLPRREEIKSRRRRNIGVTAYILFRCIGLISKKSATNPDHLRRSDQRDSGFLDNLVIRGRVSLANTSCPSLSPPGITVLSCGFFYAGAMAGNSEVDLSQLSPDQQDALRQFADVTGQEIRDAIPLLERSQWNVQVRLRISFRRMVADERMPNFQDRPR